MQPGETITPGTDKPSAAETAVPPTQPEATPQPIQLEQATDEPGIKIEAPTVSWTASEYVSHEKGASWFVMVALALVVAAVLAYVLTKDIVAVVVIAITGVTFGVFSARSPRVLNYSIGQQGVQIGQRLYPFNEFKSFAISEEGPLPSVLLMPLKRFLPPITVFFDPQNGDDIIATLSDYLPFEHKKPDAVDKFMSRIRF